MESSRRVINKNWPYCPLDPPAKGIGFRLVLEVHEQSVWRDPKCMHFMLSTRSFVECQELLCNVSGHPKQHAQLPMLVYQLLHATPEAAFGHQESVTKDFSACEECQYNFVSEYTKQSLF